MVSGLLMQTSEEFCAVLWHGVVFDVSLQRIQRRGVGARHRQGRAPSILCRDTEHCCADLHVAHLSADSQRHKHNLSLNFRSLKTWI